MLVLPIHPLTHSSLPPPHTHTIHPLIHLSTHPDTMTSMKNTRYPAKTACAALCAAALLAMTATAVTTPAARAASASDSPQVLWSFSENFDSYDTSLKLPAQNASWFGIDDANHSIKAWDSPNTALGNFLNLPRYNTGTWKSDRYVAHAIAPTAPDQTAAAQTDHIEFSFQVSMQRDYGFIGFGASLAYGSTATIDANPHLLMIRINQDASDQPVLSYTAWEGSAQTTVTVSGTGTGIADMNRYTGYLVSI
ncbi:MAG: hypothetical protein LBK99_14520, partial [Opitutaceae bacterium]|nr:hypothetical protein [Opitutaceae bacterium]